MSYWGGAYWAATYWTDTYWTILPVGVPLTFPIHAVYDQLVQHAVYDQRVQHAEYSYT